jgi:uncharacterized protein
MQRPRRPRDTRRRESASDFLMPPAQYGESETVRPGLVYNRAADPDSSPGRSAMRFCMIFRRSLLAAALLAVAASVVAPPVRADLDNPTEAQPTLPTEKLAIVTRDGSRHDFTVEMATTLPQQTVGLMFRREVPEGTGMLFDWGGVKNSDMWMRNTLAPLDMLFIDPDGKIHHIAEDTVPQSLAVISSAGEVRATLEIPAGTVEKLDIHVGDVVHQRIFGNAQ